MGDASSGFSFIIYFDVFLLISYDIKTSNMFRWFDMLLISIPDYDLEVFSDDLRKVSSIIEPVFLVKWYGCVVFL